MKKLLSMLILFPVALAVAGYFYFESWQTQGGATQSSYEYEVRDGQSFKSIARDLEDAGVIQNSLLFSWYARSLGVSGSVKSGLYLFEPQSLPKQVLDKIIRGETLKTQFSIPEGYNTWQIAKKLSVSYPKISEKVWLSAMKSSEVLAVVPHGAATVEGYLFPDTYITSPRATAPAVLKKMIDQFKNKFDKNIVEQGQIVNLTPAQIVILASIIEKETASVPEMPKISAVFHNRLKIRMRLQTDPTIIYGIWERYDGNLRKEDMSFPTPYNSYTNYGLPPGPISNPGENALRAAASPAETKDLYFVSRGDGTHIFSEDFKDHVNAVREYQIRPFKKSKQGKKQR